MKNYKSLFTILLVGIVYIISMYYYKPYEGLYHQYEGDSFSYYVYLPAFFIHHDLATLHSTMDAKFKQCMPWMKADSSYLNKYFMGTAVLQAPFFLVAHALAPYFHQAQDGFSMIYMYAIELSALFYALISLIILMMVLRMSFSDNIVAFVLLIIALSTNLYYLVVGQATFSHTYLLFWYSLLILVTIRFYATHQKRYIFFIGLICGMIILTRLNEIYVVLIPIFWGIRFKSDFVDRLKLFNKNLIPCIFAVALMFFCLIPQMLYWKISSGHFLIYSYKGEVFDFRHPHIWDGFTSGSNGWLLYCPIMILALAGIWPAIKNRHPSFVPLCVFLTVHIYVIYSWWCWFYMGSFGSRPMTEAYSLLVFPLAYTVQWFWRSVTGRSVLIVLFSFFSFVTINQAYLMVNNLFNSELGNWHFNIVCIGKKTLTYDESVVIDTKEIQPSNPIFIKKLYENSFEQDRLENSDSTEASSGQKSIRLSHGKASPGLEISIGEMNAMPGQWIKASINCMAKGHTDHNWHKSQLIIEFKRDDKNLKYRGVSLENRIDNPKNEIWHFTTDKWGNVHFYSKIPSNARNTDIMRVYALHNMYGADICVDDLKVELYETN